LPCLNAKFAGVIPRVIPGGTPRVISGVYRPRQPRESDFHRLVREHFGLFRAVYAERYARKFGHWRTVYDKAVSHFLKCGDLQRGFARVRCPDCRHEFFVAFSCKQRCICPSCSQKRTRLFGMHGADDVCLNVPHRQFVWTVPKRLRIFFRYHRDLLQQLPRLAWQSILQTYRALLGDDATPGAVLAIQTFGTLMHFNPHIHGLVTDGAFTPDGRFHSIPVNLTHEPFRRIWEDNVFRLLLDAGRIDHSVVSQIRSWRHSGFSVDRSVYIPAGDRDGLERLAQYMARSPFSLTRLLRITRTGQVVYHAEKHRPHRFPEPAADDLFGATSRGVARNFQVFDPLDFLAELTQHIPNPGEHLHRYYGHYSNKARGIRAKQADQNEFDPPQPNANSERTDPAARKRWAMLIQRVYQADPLVCPKCGGTMKVIAFIETRQGDLVRQILEYCGLWQDPPPPPPEVPPRSPPPRRRRSRARRPCCSMPEGDAGVSYEVDPEYLEHARLQALEEQDQPDLPWDA
jgi:hypothetical protein